MVRRICKIMGTIYFIFRLDLCSHEAVSFTFLSQCVRRHQTVLLVNVAQEKKRLETSFKCDNVKALIKMSNCENMVLHFSEKVQKIAAFAMLVLFFSDQTIA